MFRLLCAIVRFNGCIPFRFAIVNYRPDSRFLFILIGCTQTSKSPKFDHSARISRNDSNGASVRVDGKRNTWQVDNHGLDRQAVIKAYDALLKTHGDRKKLEISVPLLVGARDQAVFELKREKVAAELAQRKSQTHSLRL